MPPFRIFRSAASLLAACSLLGAVELSAQELLADNFDHGHGSAQSNLNFQLNQRQTGSEATVNWLSGGGSTDSFLTAGGKLRLNYQSPPAHTVWATLDRRFNSANTFRIDVEVSPELPPEAALGTLLNCGITLGMNGNGVSPMPFLNDSEQRVSLQLKLARKPYIGGSAPAPDFYAAAQPLGLYQVFIDGAQIIAGGDSYVGDPFPNGFDPLMGKPYRLRITGGPDGGGIRLRFFFEDMSRPVAEQLMPASFRADYISLFAYQNGANAAGTFAVEFDNLSIWQISGAEATRTFSYEDTVFGNYLNLDHPGLEAVKAAVSADDYATAKTELADYFANRSFPLGPPLYDRFATDNYLEVADNALIDVYGFAGHNANFKPVPYPPWAQNNDPALNDLNTVVNRFAHFNSLAKAYETTGNEAYAQRYAREITDWIDGEPWLYDNWMGSTIDWSFGTQFVAGYAYTGEIGRRMQYGWGGAYESFKSSPSLGADDHLAIFKSYRDHIRVQANPSAFLPFDDSGIQATYGMLLTSHLFPELEEAAELQQRARDRMDYCIDLQWYPDGSHQSGGSGYMFGSTDALLIATDFFTRNGWPVPQNWLDAIEDSMEMAIFYTRPRWGNFPIHNGGRGSSSDKTELAVPLFPGRQDFLWHATQGAEGAPPPFTSQYKDYAGQYVFRTGWGDEDRALYFDAAGHSGASHGWNDSMSVIYSHKNKMLLGRGNGSIAATSFSGLFVDGKFDRRVENLSQRTVEDTPDFRRFVAGDHFDYGEGWHTDGWYYGTAPNVQGVHTRQIVAVKEPGAPEKAFFLVFDSIDPADGGTHSYDAHWYLETAAPVFDAHSKTIHVSDPAGNLDLAPLNPEGVTVDNTTYGGSRPTFNWTDTGATTRAWGLLPQDIGLPASVETVTPLAVDRPGDIRALLSAPDGRSFLVSRTAADAPAAMGRQALAGEIDIVSFSPEGNVLRRFFLENPDTGTPSADGITAAASSANAYTVLPWGLKLGVVAWNGTGHTVTAVSDGLTGHTFLRTAAADDDVDNPQHLEIAFEKPTTAHILFEEGTTLPTWFDPAKWLLSGDSLSVDVSGSVRTYVAYRHEFPAGSFFFGGNDSAETGAAFNYLMAFDPCEYALDASTGGTYDIVPGGVATGNTVWNGASHTFGAIDPRLSQGDLVRTDYDDDNVSDPAHLLISLESPRDVFLAFKAGSLLPSWVDPAVWASVSHQLQVDDGIAVQDMQVYRANLGKGTHAFGGNDITETLADGNYVVIVHKTDYALEASTANPYAIVAGGTAVGQVAWPERDYAIEHVSSTLQGADWIQCSMNDESLADDEHLRLTLDKPTKLTIGFWPGSTYPAWFDAGEWRASGEELWIDVLGTKKFELFSRILDRGSYVFGGNDRPNTGAPGHYILMAQPDHPLAKWAYQGSYQVEVGAAGNGSAAFTPVAESYLLGASLTFEAYPETGYKLDAWSGSASGSDNPLAFTVSGDAVVTPAFTTDLSTFEGYMIQSTGAIRPVDGDFDGDGIPDGIEFVFGTDAGLSENPVLPSLSRNGNTLAMLFPLSTTADGFTLTPLRASSLHGPWTSTGFAFNPRPDLGPNWHEYSLQFDPGDKTIFMKLDMQLNN